jgi:hypothetical protein
VRLRLPIILITVYVVAGLIVAQQYDYFDKLGTFTKAASAVCAVLLWGPVLLGVNVQFKFTLVDL